MLQLPIIALFLRLIPEGIVLMFANHVITNTEIDKKRIFISGILLGVSTYLIRLLPIHFGVHTIIFLMLYIFLSVKINCLNFYEAVGASMTCIIMMFFFEWVSMYGIINLLGISQDIIFNNTLVNTLVGLPSIVMLFLSVLFILFLKRYINKKDV